MDRQGREAGGRVINWHENVWAGWLAESHFYGKGFRLSGWLRTFLPALAKLLCFILPCLKL